MMKQCLAVVRFIVVLTLTLSGCSKNSTGPTGATGTNAAASPWTVSVVDSMGNVGEYTSIALDAAGNPRISYLNRDSGKVMYTEWNGSAWTRKTIGDAAGPYVVGGRNSLALDGNGNPFVLYHHADVAYELTSRSGSVWNTPSAISFSEAAWAFLGHNSLAIDPKTGTVHAALWFFDSKNGYLLAHWQTGMGSAAFVDGYNGVTGKNNSIALDDSGKMHISYEGADASSNTFLKYARWTGSAWQTSIVDTIQTTEGFAQLTSIKVDASGKPRIAYYSHHAGAYKYASWNGLSWDITTIEKYGSVGWEYVSLALDSQGNPHVAMLTGYYKLKYAYRSGGSWVSEVVDGTTGGDNCSIAAGKDGSVHISYYDDNNGDLKYARRSP